MENNSDLICLLYAESLFNHLSTALIFRKRLVYCRMKPHSEKIQTLSELKDPLKSSRPVCSGQGTLSPKTMA